MYFYYAMYIPTEYIKNLRKTGCNRWQLVFRRFFYFSKWGNWQLNRPEKPANRNRRFGFFRLRFSSVAVFFRLHQPDPQTLTVTVRECSWPLGEGKKESDWNFAPSLKSWNGDTRADHCWVWFLRLSNSGIENIVSGIKDIPLNRSHPTVSFNPTLFFSIPGFQTQSHYYWVDPTIIESIPLLLLLILIPSPLFSYRLAVRSST